jgi:adenine-specific DNA-methyltransferase
VGLALCDVETREPEQVKAFRDTWRDGVHSYLSYLRDRLGLARDLLSEAGSVFVQISDVNLHHVREILDEVFGSANFAALISYSKTGGFASATLSRTGDYVLWYAKDIKTIKFRKQFVEKDLSDAVRDDYDQVELFGGSRRALTRTEKDSPLELKLVGRVFTDGDSTSQDEGAATGPFELCGMVFHPGAENHWKAPLPVGMRRLARARRFSRSAIHELVRLEKDFNACWPLRNKGTKRKSSAFLRWRISDYRKGISALPLRTGRKH